MNKPFQFNNTIYDLSDVYQVAIEDSYLVAKMRSTGANLVMQKSTGDYARFMGFIGDGLTVINGDGE